MIGRDKRGAKGKTQVSSYDRLGARSKITLADIIVKRQHRPKASSFGLISPVPNLVHRD